MLPVIGGDSHLISFEDIKSVFMIARNQQFSQALAIFATFTFIQLHTFTKGLRLVLLCLDIAFITQVDEAATL